MEPYQELEAALGEWVDRKGMTVVCSSGTAALHLALEAMRLPPGSKILIPNFTMVACARAAVLAGLEPVFVDPWEDLLLDVNLAYKACNTIAGIKAIMPVHVYGRRCDMDSIHDLAKEFDLRVVEDLAEAHGIDPDRRTDAACWSYYKNKIVAGEEGGSVAFRDADKAELAKQLRSLGFTPAHDFHHIPRGHNYRLANALAVPILESLSNLTFNSSRRRSAERIFEEACPADWRQPTRNVVWVYDIRIPGLSGSEQDRIVAALNKAGIPARHGFKPLAEQAEFKGCTTMSNGRIDSISCEVLYFAVSSPSAAKIAAPKAFEVIKRIV